MPLPVSTSLSLLGAVRFVVNATGESEDCVRTALIDAGITGAISATGCQHSSAHPNLARYFAHPVLSGRENVPSWAWSGPFDWRASRVGRYDLVRIDRAEIGRWLAPARPKTADTAGTGEQVAAAALEPQAANAAPRAAKRPNGSKQTMEAAAREYIAATYPNGIPAGKTDKMIAAEYTTSTRAPMSERTVRRARTGKG
jgi:hypothetical protein